VKYIVISFWALILGQVLGYIAESLAEVQPGHHVVLIAIFSLVVALIVILIDKIGITDTES